MKINVILAHCREYGIGYGGKMAWRIRSDLQLFSKLTTGRGDYKNAIVMGRKTWQSLPPLNRPLDSRDNLILSRSPEDAYRYSQPQSHPHVAWFFDIDAVLSHCESKQYDEVWIIGGQQLYSEFIGANAPYRSLVNSLHITRIDADFTCDAFCSEGAISDSALQEYFVPVSTRCEIEKCVNSQNVTVDVNVTFCEYVNKMCI
jgi:dihydrofolate reductase